MSPKKSPTRVRRSFTPEFKRDAVRLVEKGESVTEVARDLGIARSLLQYWKRQLGAEGDGREAPELNARLYHPSIETRCATSAAATC